MGDSGELRVVEVMNRCRTNPEAKGCFLGRATEGVTCGHCRHFQQGYFGHCTKGQPESGAGLWDTDRRLCMTYREGPCLRESLSQQFSF